MVVLGNPPYKGESQNNGDWIKGLMNDYKKEPDSDMPLKERNPKWINDDYVKFIRLGQYYVDKNEEGVLAYINNHSFLDNPTFRSMRWNLLKSFDKIYIIDLHGSCKKKEVCPDGSKDENVFDIQQGVSINIFVKTGKKSKKRLAEVYHCDVWGKRQAKYDILEANNLYSLNFKEINPTAPFYFFIPKVEIGREAYEKGFCINELMPVNSVGIVTSNDSVLINDSREQLLQNVSICYNKKANTDFVHKINYRPFDTRYIYYDPTKLERPRKKVMQHFILGNNVGFVSARSNKSNDCSHFYISKYITEAKLGERTTQSYVFPLYLYDDNTITEECERRPNLKPDIINKITQNIGLTFESEKSGDADKFAPIDVLDYIYAVLHSPAYREKYKEFLKTDFPCIPYPTFTDEFRHLAGLGCELRQIHLLEHPALQGMITDYLYLGEGNNIVEKVRWEPLSESVGRIWINGTQYFDSVPLTAWEFYIGGYQPVQKWLKDRTSRVLGFVDLSHYQCIIKALVMTDEIMKKIDM